MQDQFFGFPKRELEPTLWTPRFCQVSTNAFNNQSTLLLRRPTTSGSVQLVGQRVFAEAAGVFDSAGGGNFTLFMELPYVVAPTPGGQSLVVGTFYMEKPGGNMYQGVCQGISNTNQAFFRAGTGISANGFGNGPAVTIAAGDVFNASVSYVANT